MFPLIGIGVSPATMRAMWKSFSQFSISSLPTLCGRIDLLLLPPRGGELSPHRLHLRLEAAVQRRRLLLQRVQPVGEVEDQAAEYAENVVRGGGRGRRGRHNVPFLI